MKIASVLILLALAAQAHGEETVWDFQPPPDHFSDKAFLDLRSLNEHEAGEKGFVRLAPDGSFVLGDGTPARFWAVEDDSVFRIRKDLPPIDTAKHARFLAKHGVNFVRCLINITPTGNDITAIDEQERDVVWRLVATLKKEGIYTLLTPYWSSSSRVKPGPTGWTTKPAVRTEKGKQLGCCAALRKKQGQDIVSTGKAPMQIVEADLNIVITNSKLAKLHILDASLEEISAVPLTPDAGKASITFPKNALYAVAAAE